MKSVNKAIRKKDAMELLLGKLLAMFRTVFLNMS